MIYYMIMFYMFMLINFLLMLFMYLLINWISIYIEFEIFILSSLKLEFLILLDWVSILFISVVMMISMMVILYSLEYMSNDLNLNRFMNLIIMFMISMLLMILSPNMFSILLGWDGLGLVSYCLVIYYQGKSSFNSGMVTVLTNRLGDIMILMSLGMLMIFGTWNFMFLNKINELIYFFLLISSITKSAQIPFSSWLPLAMAAPTPVSSLVHSSTLVTAGVYLMIRLNYLLNMDLLIKFILIISMITMFMSGLGANFEYDLKKIIALSTLSQLGIMFFCLSMKLMDLSLFHLLTHAMFKSLLFMCAGVIIHNMLGSQDIRYISMTLINLPMVSIMFNCSSLSLCGIPFLSGFFSKDLILEMFLMSKFNMFIMMILFLSMGFTISYTIRLMYFSFIKISQMNIYMNYNMINSKMGFSMYMLFMMSIFMGVLLSWMLFSVKNYIYLTKYFKFLIYMFMMFGILMSLFLINFYMKLNLYKYCNIYYKMFMMLWFVPLLFNSWIPKVYKFSNQLMNNMDLGWLEYFFFYNFIFYINKMFKLDNFNKNFMNMMIMIFFFMLLLMF